MNGSGMTAAARCRVLLRVHRPPALARAGGGKAHKHGRTFLVRCVRPPGSRRVANAGGGAEQAVAGRRESEWPHGSWGSGRREARTVSTQAHSLRQGTLQQAVACLGAGTRARVDKHAARGLAVCGLEAAGCACVLLARLRGLRLLGKRSRRIRAPCWYRSRLPKRG